MGALHRRRYNRAVPRVVDAAPVRSLNGHAVPLISNSEIEPTDSLPSFSFRLRLADPTRESTAASKTRETTLRSLPKRCFAKQGRQCRCNWPVQHLVMVRDKTESWNTRTDSRARPCFWAIIDRRKLSGEGAERSASGGIIAFNTQRRARNASWFTKIAQP